MNKDLKITINQKEYLFTGVVNDSHCVNIPTPVNNPFIKGESYIFLDNDGNKYGGIFVEPMGDGTLDFCQCKRK